MVDKRTIDDGRPDPVIRFTETRGTPLVEDVGKYYFTIVRFQLAGATLNLPLTIPQIQLNQPDPNLTIYSTTLRCQASYDVPAVGPTNFTMESQVWLEHFPEFTDEPVPPVPAGGVQGTPIADTKYYWITSFAHWCDMVNTAFEDAVADVQAQFAVQWVATGTAAPVPTLQTEAPYVIYDQGSNLFTIYCDTYGYGGADRISAGSTADENWTIYFNSNLYGMMANFETLFVGQDLVNGKEYELVVRNIKGQNIGAQASPDASVPASTKRYYLLTQDYASTGQLWSPINSIVFTSLTMGVSPEATNPPVDIGGNLTEPGSTTSSQNIITDISLPINSAGDWRQNIVYVPSAQYRLCSLPASNRPLQTIDLNVGFKSRFDGQIIPLRAYNLSSISMKIAFIKKTLYQGKR